ncbi:putative calcium-transporting ATPase 13, plasma membrane-type [Pistacia vera]|uniref:putative calcium-transporting ATPase 13, plasma membrane-type n=1 Tax=Pistacia vera TaxID=55513 RepID=UPI0012636420|nr:putative calcium-transporting ATPase 13, plasma membrane-type [Pistacia vera]
MDDNFASAATVLRWGRCVYANIQKFIQFQLTVNVVTFVINMVAVVSAGEVPLAFSNSPVVVDESYQGHPRRPGFYYRETARELMDKPPPGRSQPLITNIMWRNLLAQASFQIAVLLTLLFRGESIFSAVNDKVNNTMIIFNTFVLCQVFNKFNARKLEKKKVFEDIRKNKLFLGIIRITIVLQMVMVEFLMQILRSWSNGFYALVLQPIGWIVKCIPDPEKPLFSYLDSQVEQGFRSKAD